MIEIMCIIIDISVDDRSQHPSHALVIGRIRPIRLLSGSIEIIIPPMIYYYYDNSRYLHAYILLYSSGIFTILYNMYIHIYGEEGGISFDIDCRRFNPIAVFSIV